MNQDIQNVQHGDDDATAQAGGGGGGRKVGKFVIESGIPIPEGSGVGSRGKYPFAELAVGESVVISGVAKATLSSALTSWRTRKGIDLTMRPCFEGFRVFRRK